MTRTEKWKDKREHIEVMNKYMTRFDHLRMAYEKPKYEGKHAKEYDDVSRAKRS